MPVLPLEPVPLELGNAKEDAGILLAADRVLGRAEHGGGLPLLLRNSQLLAGGPMPLAWLPRCRHAVKPSVDRR